MFSFLKWFNPLQTMNNFIFMAGEGDGGTGDGGGDGATGDSSWRAKLPDDLRSEASLDSFKDDTELIPMPINVARSFVNTKKLVGKTNQPPTTDEEWDATYERLGRPKESSEYTFGVPDTVENELLKDLLTADLTWFQGEAHKVGLNDKQATTLFNSYIEKSKSTLDERTGMTEKHFHDSEVALRTEYGNNFEGKMVLMNRGVTELDERVGGGLKQVIQDTGLAGDKNFIKAMVLVGEMMAPDLGLDKLTGEPAVSEDSLDTQIAELQRSTAYLNGSDPAHAVTVQKVYKLMQQRHGKTSAGPLTRKSFIK